MARCSSSPTHGGGDATRRPRWSASTAPKGRSECRSDRRRRRGPLRHDSERRDETAMARCSSSSTTAAAIYTPATLFSFNGANGANPSCRSDRRRRRGPLRHDRGRGVRRWHSVRARQPARQLHADHAVQLQPAPTGRNPFAGLIADAAGDLFGTTLGAGQTAMARCSKLPIADLSSPTRCRGCHAGLAHATFGTTINVAAAGVLANDTPGATGDTLTVSAVDGLSQDVGQPSRERTEH